MQYRAFAGMTILPRSPAGYSLLILQQYIIFFPIMQERCGKNVKNFLYSHEFCQRGGGGYGIRPYGDAWDRGFLTISGAASISPSFRPGVGYMYSPKFPGGTRGIL